MFGVFRNIFNTHRDHKQPPKVRNGPLRGLSHVPPLNLSNSRRCHLCTIISKSPPKLSFDVFRMDSIKLFGNTWNDCKSDDRIYANVLD